MSEQFTNKPSTTLNGAINNSVTSLVVTSATGFPTSGDFRIVVTPGAGTEEIMTVTAVSGTTFTISRASEVIAGVQTARSHSDGATIKHVLTAGALRNFALPTGTIGASASWSSGSLGGTGAYYPVPLANEHWDSDLFHSTVTANSKFTIPAGQGGKYSFVGSFYGSTSNGYGTILVNGVDTSWYSHSGTSNALIVSGTVELKPGDYIELGINWGNTTINASHVAITKLDSGKVGSGIGASVYASVAQSVSAATEYTVGASGTGEFDTEVRNTDGFWSSSNEPRVTIPAGMSGIYVVRGHVYHAGSTSLSYAYLRRNGTTGIPGSEDDTASSDHSLHPWTMGYFAAGEYIEIRAYRSTGTTSGGGSTAQNSIEIYRLDSLASNSTTTLVLDYDYAGSDINGASVSAGTWTDVLSNQNFAVTNANSILEIDVRGFIQAIDSSGGDDFLDIRVNIDSGGTPILKMISGDIGSGTSVYQNPLAGAGTVKVTGLSVGTHTIKPQIYIGGGGDFYLRPSAASGFEFLSIQITEIAPTTSNNQTTRIIRGQVTSTGTVAVGSGFTSSKTATGKYTITFNTAFINIPAVTCSVMYNNNEIGDGNSGLLCYVDTLTTTEAKFFVLKDAGATFSDRRFNFIAVETA